MSDAERSYDNGGWFEPPRPVTFTLADDECIIAKRADVWRCIRDHKCAPNRWWEAFRPNWSRLTYDQQRALLGLPSHRRRTEP